MKKRLLSVITALALCLSLLPTAALAVTDEGDYWTDVLIPWNQSLDGDVLDSRGTLTSAAYVADNGIYEIWAGGNVLQLQAYKETSDMSVVHFAFHEVTTTNTTNTEAVRFRFHVVDETHITIQCIGNAAPYYNQTLYILPQHDQPIDGKYLGWNSVSDVFLSDEPVLIELKDQDLKCVSTGRRLFSYGYPKFRKMQETLSVKKEQTFTYDGTVKLPVITGTNNNPQRTSEVNYGLDGVDTWYTKSKATEDAGFRKDVGSYQVYIRVKRQKVTNSGASGNDTFVFGPITVNIVNQAQITRDAAAIAGLTYNGKTQELVSPANGTGGTVKYSMDNANWSTDIPTAKDAGTYTVYYKVFGEAFNDGTSTVPISDSETKSVSVTIAKQALKLNSDEVKQNQVKYFTGRKLSPPCMKEGEYGTTSKIIPADAITYGGDYLKSAVGTYTATVEPSSNYTWKDGSTDPVSLNWKIISRTINLTGVTAQSRPYEAGNLNVNITWDGTVNPINIDDDAQNALNEALSSGKFTITVDPIGVMEDDAVGTNKRVRVKATMTGEEEYLAGIRLNYIGGSDHQLWVFNCVDITKPEYTLIAPTAAENLTYDGTEKTLLTTGASSQEETSGATDITYSYRLGTDGTWSSSFPTATAAGTYDVYYRANETTNYVETVCETPVQVTIKPYEIALPTDDDLEAATYDGSEQTASLKESYEHHDKVEFTTGQVQTNAGTHSVTLQLKDSNYTWPNAQTTYTLNWTISPKTIGIDWGSSTLTYNGSEQAPTATATGLVGEDTCTITVTGGQTNAGENYTATATAVGNSNYTLPDSGTTQTFTISPKAVTVTIAAKSSAYGAAIAELTATDNGIVSGDTGVYTLSTTATSSSSVGSYDITGTSNSTNYTFTFTGGTNAYTISQATNAWTTDPAISGWTYGDTAKTPDGAAKFGTVTVEYKVKDAEDSAYAAAVPTSAGSYTVRFTVAATDNYTGLTETKELTITPKTIGINWTDTALTYNGQAQNPTATATGLVGNDTCAITVTGEQTNAGDHTATAASVSNSNYQLPANNTTTFSIAPKEITITGVTVNNKVYDGGVNATITDNGTLSKNYDGENLSFTVGTASYDDKNVGMDKTVTFSGFALTGSASGNYTLTQPASVTANIAKKPVTAAVTVTTKTYDGNTTAAVSAVVTTTEGLIDGDTITITGLTGTFADANVGTGKTVTINAENKSITGDDASNYAVTIPTTATGTISKATNRWTTEPSITGWTYGENAKTPTYQAACGNDTVVVEYRLVSGVDEDYTTTVPTNAGSYTVRFTVAATDNYTGLTETKELTIGKKTIGIQWGDTTFTYNGQAQKPTATATGLVGNDTCAITVTGEQTNVGDNHTATAESLDNGNYQPPSDKTTTFTISPKTVTVTAGTYKVSKVYDGTTTKGTPSGDLTVTGILDADSGVTVNATPGAYTSPNVGGQDTAEVSLVLSGDTNENYQLAAATVNVPCTITAKPITISTASATNRNYAEGDTSVEADVTFTGAVTTLTKNTDYTVTGEMADADAGDGKTVNVTVTLRNGNYALAVNTTTTTVDIGKIAYLGATAANCSAMYGNTGRVDLSNYLADGYVIGAITKTNGDIFTGAPGMDGTALTFSFANVPGNVGQTAVITVPVTGATNYDPYSIEVTVTVEAKTVPTVTAPTAAAALIYSGEAQTLISAGTTTGGEMQYSLTSGTGYSTELPTAVNAGDYTVYYKVVGSSDYADVAENSLTVTIGKKEVTATPKDVTITRGSAIPAFGLIYTGLLGEDTLTPSTDPTFTCFEADGTTSVSTRTAAGAYTITWTNTDIFDDETNYRVVAAPGTLTINNPSYSGGGSSTPSYSVTVPEAENGTITVSPKSASRGGTVTITVTPDDGYTLETLTATDAKGNKITLTDKGSGKYTFQMPASKVEITATFMEDNTMLNFFVDVPAGAYYYGAVLWAAENGITGGVDDTHFAPNAPCTRAQIVTFLWRAAGSPAPLGIASSFTDVPADAYYAKAVQWAVEQGITVGISATTFSPDATCTRAQSVTFLYRAAKAAAAGNNPFTDVADNAYYTDAVKWAVAEGVTAGTSATTFSPDQACTRAQIVTFIYRAET